MKGEKNQVKEKKDEKDTNFMFSFLLPIIIFPSFLLSPLIFLLLMKEKIPPSFFS